MLVVVMLMLILTLMLMLMVMVMVGVMGTTTKSCLVWMSLSWMNCLETESTMMEKMGMAIMMDRQPLTEYNSTFRIGEGRRIINTIVNWWMHFSTPQAVSYRNRNLNLNPGVGKSIWHSYTVREDPVRNPCRNIGIPGRLICMLRV